MTLLGLSLSVAVALVGVFHVLSAQRDPPPPALPANYSRVSCDFEGDDCGWTNVGGSLYPLTWRRGKRRQAHGRVAMVLSTDGDKKGRLASPWLDPVDNYRCQLRFKYAMNRERINTCELNLIRETESGQEQVLTTLAPRTRTGYMVEYVTQRVSCAGEERYRLVFEGWKPCRGDEMGVDDLKFTATSSSSSSSSACNSLCALACVCVHVLLFHVLRMDVCVFA